VLCCIRLWIIYFSTKHEVCRLLQKVHPKPPQFSPYLRKALQIIKLPIRQATPIPWEELRALHHLSDLRTPHHVPRVTLRLPDKARNLGDTEEAREKRQGKRKYVEISTPTAEEDDWNIKEEEEDVSMVSRLLECFPILFHMTRNLKHYPFPGTGS
jgi:hypothetical protein